VLRATRTPGTKVEIVVAPDPEAEAAFIADEIETQTKGGVKLDQIAVLYRSNQQSEPIESALKERQIPFQLFGGTQFYERKEIKDLISYLRVVINPKDEISLRRVINYPARQIGDVAIERLEAAALSRNKPLFGAVCDADTVGDLTSQARAGCRELASVIATAKRALDAGRPAADVAEAIASSIRLRDDVFAASGSAKQAARRWANVEALLTVLRRHGDTSRQALAELLQFLSVKTDSDEPSQGELVTLTTMHGAKGLEWPCVFIAGVEEGLLPHSRALDARATDVGARGENDVEEERRLFYVSITRAKDRLWLCRAEQRALRGKMAPRAPSRFVADIPEELLERRSVGGPAAPTSTAARGAELLAKLGSLSGVARARR
jgi:DNA helicase-2/ATP-dependent DNA helicase PcrA